MNVKLHQVLRGHKGYIFRLSWSPTGKLLASPSQDRTIKIWDYESGHLLKSLLGHSEEVNSVAWCPTQEGQLASCGDDCQIILWDWESGKIIRSWNEHTDEVNDLSWSPDGNFLASGGDDKKIIVRNLKNENILELNGHSHTVWSLNWSPSGRWLASASDDQKIILWSLDNGDKRILQGHTSTVRSVAWFPDGEHLLSGGRDGTIRVWDINSPNPPRIREAHDSIVTSVSISHSGEFLASKAHDGYVKIWLANDLTCLAKIPEDTCDRWSISLAYHPKEQVLATLGENSDVIRLWRLNHNTRDTLSYGSLDYGISKDIFISYSHHDQEWLDKVKISLIPLSRNHKLSIWSDKEISPGALWYPEIDHALAKCKIAILLVTPHFLASEFIINVELPVLLTRAKNRELTLLWIPIQHSLYDETGLEKFQALISPQHPLESLGTAGQQKCLVEMAKKIREFMK